MTITAQQGEFALGLQYAKYSSNQPVKIYASGKATFSGQPTADDTITVSGQAYTFKAGPASAGHVKIGTTLAETVQNLADAINGANASGYHSATLQVLGVLAEAAGNVLYVTSFFPDKATGNAITLAKSSTAITLSGSTLSGGISGAQAVSSVGRVGFIGQPTAADTVTIDSMVYTFVSTTPAAYSSNDVEVRIGSTVYETVARLAKAINDTGVDGTEYSAGTPAHSTVSATYKDKVVSLAAITAGVAGNSIVLTESGTATTVTGSGTLVSGQDATVYNQAGLTWYRLRTREVDYQDNQMQETLPMEIGSTMVPTGAYKSGVNVQGSASIFPRLETSLGILLLAALGKVTTTNPSAGVYQHVFTFNSNEQDIPWLAARRMIPGRDSVFGNGIIGYDNKVNMMRLVVAAASPVEMMLQLMGREPVMDNHPEVWGGQTFEDYKSVPLACKGTFKLPTLEGLPTPLPVTQVVIEMANVTTTPREEMIVGSYFMDDVVPRARAMTLRFVYKWQSAALAQQLFGSQLKATAWSPQPLVLETSGTDYAFDLLVESPYNITGTETPYSLRVRGNSLFLQPAGGIRMRAGDIILQEVMGNLLYHSNGYVEFILTNGHASYAVPSEP